MNCDSTSETSGVDNGQEEADAEVSSSETATEGEPQGTKPDKVFEVKCNCIRDTDGHISPAYGHGKDIPSARNAAHQFCVGRGFSEETNLGTISETYTFQHDSCVVINELTE